MMELSKTSLQCILERQLEEKNLDIVDVVSLPQHADRLVRLRSIREVLEDFDRSADGDTKSYLIQIKPKKAEPANKTVQDAPVAVEAEVEQELIQKKHPTEGIYLNTGKLNIPFLLQNASLLFQSGEYSLARNIYRTIIQAGERTALGLFGTARCLEAEGKLDEARTHYEDSIAYHPDLETYLRLSSLLLKQNKPSAAAETLLRALHIKDLPPTQRLDLHRNCALCWMKSGDRIKAQQHYEKALEISPANDDVNCQLGLIFLEEKRIPEARKCFQESAAVNPKNAEALCGLANCFLAENDKRNAHDYFAKSLDINLKNPSAIFHLVKCAFELKTFATAARLVEEYTEVAPVNANLLYSLAGLQFHLSRVQDARFTAKRILELAPDHNGAKELLGMMDRYASGMS